jgi:hypothetical protein
MERPKALTIKWLVPQSWRPGLALLQIIPLHQKPWQLNTVLNALYYQACREARERQEFETPPGLYKPQQPLAWSNEIEK